jgi:hypothetical protein
MKILLLVAAAVGLGAIVAGNMVPDVTQYLRIRRMQVWSSTRARTWSAPAAYWLSSPSNQSGQPGYGDQTSR